MKITYKRMYGGGYLVFPVGREAAAVTISENENAVPVAETFGMRLRHKPGCLDRTGSDGTVDCYGCAQTAGAFVMQALAYLRAHEGKTAEDPGYFSELAPEDEPSDDEPQEPEEDDYELVDGDVTSLYSRATRKLLYDTEQGRPAIRAWLEADGYWPNVWVISDHGNAILVTDWT